jgi:flagellar basal-body rod modification protein FlgD
MIVTSPTVQETLNVTGASSRGDEKDSKNLDQTDFLTLLVAQLKNQDPMNPMENADFTAQMAQFSSLEQLMNVNENLEILTTSANATNSAQAMALIGKEVKAAGENIHVKNGVGSDISFELPESASKVLISIEDESGNVFRTIEQTSMSAGAHQIAWDGKGQYGAPLPDGLYTYSVSAKDDNGSVMAVETFTRGIVDTISFDNGIGYIHIGELKYMLSEVLEVAEVADQEPVTDGDQQDNSGDSSGDQTDDEETAA